MSASGGNVWPRAGATHVAQILDQMVEPEQASGFVEAFLCGGDAAERAPGGEPRLLRREPFIHERAHLEVEVRVDFVREIARRPAAPPQTG